VDNLVGDTAKLQQNYFNPLTKKLFTFNFWVLYTDYKNLTVVYSCEKTMTDGTCSPADTYLWTLSRRTSHTPAEMKTIKDVGSSVCVDVPHLRHVEHKSACPTA
jgi:lipocalin